ncbi:ABC transporter ATP-binding protein [Leucobacter albus]|uniref:ABC transporter ATP-binding protein n=1 Tax=Leucobacter albus TaxID=272210 RepID=A0ABW3TS44_9MICO
MTSSSDQTPTESAAAARNDRLKPLELVVISCVLAVFAGLIVLMSSRSLMLTLIFAGIAFVVSFAFMGLLGIGSKQNKEGHGTGKL